MSSIKQENELKLKVNNVLSRNMDINWKDLTLNSLLKISEKKHWPELTKSVQNLLSILKSKK